MTVEVALAPTRYKGPQPHGPRHSSWRPAERLAGISLTLTLSLIIVTLAPFSYVDANTIAASAGSNPTRQALLLMAGAITAGAIAAGGRLGRPQVPWPLVALFGFILISILWSKFPEVATRRSISLIVTSFCVIFSVAILGTRHALTICSAILGAVVIVNLASIPLIDTAVHSSVELDRGLVGDWKGMHDHKNNAASVTCFGIIVFMAQFTLTRRIRYIALIIASAIFLIGAQSDTALFGMTAAAAFVVIAYTAKRSSAGWAIWAGVATSLALSVVLAVVAFDPASILRDPRALTGRVDVWNTLWRFFLDNPLLGAGFGSFWQLGPDGPALDYNRAWAGLSSPHGHNGYLDALASLGIFGAALAFFALVVWPFLKLARSGIRGSLRDCAAAGFLFVAIHNVLETSYLSAADGAWLLWCVLVGLILQPTRKIL